MQETSFSDDGDSWTSNSVESTALRLITGLGSSEVQPQLTRFNAEPKQVNHTHLSHTKPNSKRIIDLRNYLLTWRRSVLWGLHICQLVNLSCLTTQDIRWEIIFCMWYICSNANLRTPMQTTLYITDLFYRVSKLHKLWISKKQFSLRFLQISVIYQKKNFKVNKLEAQMKSPNYYWKCAS